MCDLTLLSNWISENTANIIAFCALGATFWQAYISRRHNKLSVRPYLTTWESTDNNGYINFLITNNGVGPAKIKKFSIYVDGKLVSGHKLEPHQKALSIIFSNYQFEWHGSYLGIDYMVPAGEENTLAAIKFLDRSPSAEEFESAISRIQVTIAYESIYEEKFTYDSKSESEKQKIKY